MSLEHAISEANDAFPGFEQSTQLRLYYFMDFMKNVQRTIMVYKRIMGIIGVIATIIHVYILTRKSMGRFSNNIIMIGLGISDIQLMTISIYGLLQEITNRSQNSCNGPLTYAEIYFIMLYVLFFENFCRRCTSWLALMMTLVRVVALKTVTSKNSYFSSTKCGIHVIKAVVFLSFILAFFQFFVYYVGPSSDEWMPPRNCPDPNSHVNVTDTEYFVFERSSLGPYYITINGIAAKLVPCVAFPILTAMLILELRKAKRAQKESAAKKQSEKSDRTTALVTLIAISFCIAEIPQGILKLVELYYYERLGFVYITFYTNQVFMIIGFINSVSHIIICYAMATTYRKTVKTVFAFAFAKTTRKPSQSVSVSASASTSKLAKTN